MTLGSLLARSDQQKALDGVYFDDLNGFAGTDYPIGTAGYPSNNLADVITIMAARNTYRLYLSGSGAHAITLTDLFDAAIVGNPAYAITIDPGATVIIESGLECDTLTNTTGTINIYGNFQSSNSLENFGVGNISIYGKCKVGNSIPNYDGVISVYGSCEIGDIQLTGTGMVFINGDCLIGTTVNNTSSGTITVQGNLQIGTHLINGVLLGSPGGGNIYIYGKLSISDYSDGYLDNTGGNIIYVGNDCHISTALTNTTGTVNIVGQTFVGTFVAQTDTGSLNFDGDLQISAGHLTNTTGVITIIGDCTADNITNTTGVITIIGDCTAVSDIDQVDVGSLNFLGNLQVATGHVVNSGGDVSIFGKLDINGDGGGGEGYLDNTGGGYLFVGNDCHIAGGNPAGLTNTTGFIVIQGDLDAPYGIDQTDATSTGSIYIFGNCKLLGQFPGDPSINIAGANSFTIFGKLDVSGDIVISQDCIIVYADTTIGGVFDNSSIGSSYFTGNLTVRGNFINTGAGDIGIFGNTRIEQNITNSGGGDLTITGKLEVYGNSGFDNTGGGNVNINGGCYMPGSFINTSAGVGIYGDCQILGGFHNTTGTVTITGNCFMGIVMDDAGSITIDGNVQGGITNPSTGTITIYGNFQDGGGGLDNSGAGGTVDIKGIGYITGTIHNHGTLSFLSAPLHWSGDVPVGITAIVASSTVVFLLDADYTVYEVRKLRLKCEDPGANTVTVRLYEIVNSVITLVDSFDITNANYASYFSLMDMFGIDHLYGHELEVTVRASADGPYDVTGSYGYGLTRVPTAVIPPA
jgi:hypothetical protein